MSDIFEKLKTVKEKFDKLNESLTNPNILKNKQKFKETTKEIKNLEPLMECFKKYEKENKDFVEAKELLEDGGLDKDFKAMVKQQFEESSVKIKNLEQELKILLLPKDPNDEKNVIIEIRGGAGGEEAALFSSNLFRMYSMYAEKKGFKTEVLNLNETGIGGLKEISFEVKGHGAYSKFKFESGVHRVQRVPETEAQGRIHTSTVTVAVLPQADEVEFNLNPSDIEVDTFRASGAGGQHINKTESAIRLTHVPTGLVVECQDERSQFKNKEKAMKILRSKLYLKAQKEAEEKIASQRRLQVGTGDRSERIRTYNFPQKRVTDHRIGLSLYSIENIMNGDLDELVEALILKEQALKLSAGLEE